MSNDVLLEGIWNCNSEAIKSAIENGADVNCRDFRKREQPTALHLAFKMGREEIAAYLISKGANVNATDKKGCTSLFHLEMCYDKCAMSKLLIKSGADVNITNGLGESVLEHCDPEVAVILKNVGAK